MSFALLSSLAADKTPGFAFSEDVSDWHPGRTVMIEGAALANMRAQLVYTQPDGSVRPGRTSSWNVDERGTAWTFKLRHGLTSTMERRSTLLSTAICRIPSASSTFAQSEANDVGLIIRNSR